MTQFKCTFCNQPFIRKQYHMTKTFRPFCSMKCYGFWQRGKSFGEQSKPVREVRYCSIADCGRIHFGRGYCKIHYGNPNYIPKAPRQPNHICRHCRKQFHDYRKDAQYCSRKCCSVHRGKPYIIKKGYRKVLLPDHPRADSKGYVFEHIIVMGAIIGEPVIKGKVIHHIDGNKQNNSPENLKLHNNHSEHMAHHYRPSP